MKRSVISVLSLLFGSLFLYSCEKCSNPTITQPTDEDAKWLVYKVDEPYPLFENEKDSLIKSFVFDGVSVQNVPAEGKSLSDDCIDKLDTQVFGRLSDTTNTYPALYTYFLKRPDKTSVRVAVHDRGDWAIDKDNPTYESLEVNGFPYQDVYEVIPDSVNRNSVRKILFNKEYGFLLVDFYNGKQLRLYR